ncbi:glycine betaine ABC transporter substrate-binding protein [Roseospira goensis]|uniref:Osmoprotectant transport system substrate-binding protein n=1 Tax=Roseospira goensis TaxID=391922 RepID=A0A7W6RY87_9PROT|nr:glycine betaine ABC transporter substrate-binding protein [Roseospira goensis]MBB4284784.1 osmoprotectant transport system substrate-binding protein [Roseospira goensis]
MFVRRTFLGAVGAATLLLAGGGLAGGAAAETIVVGGKNFTEQQLMAEMTAQYLAAKGYDVDKNAGMGSTVLRSAMENDQIDVYWEYTGTSLITYNKVDEQLSPEETYQRVKDLDAEKGIVWLEPSAANNTYALMMEREDAEAMGIESISDLAAKINGGDEMTFASNAEFAERPDGLRPLQEEYGFRFGRANLKKMDSGLTYKALDEDQVDVALGFATDGRIAAFDFVVLDDDKGYFPNYALAPTIRAEVLEANPDLGDLLNALSAKLDDSTMASLNARVDVEKETIEAVSESFLTEQGLI